MKAAEIKVGGMYWANVSGKKVRVRVDAIEQRPGSATGSQKFKAQTYYTATNLSTGRILVFRSAKRFLGSVADAEAACQKVGAAIEQATIGSISGVVPSFTEKVRQFKEHQANGDQGPSHVVVIARAGTGKTTTLVGGLQVLKGIEPTTVKYTENGPITVPIVPSPQQKAVWDAIAESRGARFVCFAAFNWTIAQELKGRVPPGCDAMTMHSLGYKAINKSIGYCKVDDKNARVPNFICEIIGTDIWDLRKTDPVMLEATTDLVRLCKVNLVGLDRLQAGELDARDWAEDLDQLASYYDVELNSSKDRVYTLVPQVLARCLDVARDKTVDFNDQIWLPVALRLPVFKYDLLLVDECLPSWTPVMLADGRSMTIKEIVDSDQPIRVRAYDTARGQPRNCNVIGRQRILNQKPLVKVKVQHHHSIRGNHRCNFVVCTIDHKVWTINRGWVPAGELRRGDDVIVETAARTTQKGKITKKGCDHLSVIQKGNRRGLGNNGNSSENFNRIKGGNGRPAPLAERVLSEALGEGWGPLTVKTGEAPQFGRGTHPSGYKLDIANAGLMVAIEVDGPCHRGREEEDNKKQTFLEEHGWTVIRVSNRRAIQETAAVVKEILGCEDDCPRPAKVVSVDPSSIPDDYVYDITVEDCHNFYANGILVHNCQDLNRAQQALARMAGKRLIFCGDDRQSIYQFAGADSQSIPRLIEELRETERGVTVLPLTVTRRCGKKIVTEAQKIVPDFEAHEDNPEGEILNAAYEDASGPTGLNRLPLYIDMAREGDFVLCRVNAPLVSQAFKFLKRGVKANIQGRDIGKGLISLVKRLKAQSVQELIRKLDDWREKEVKKEQAKRFPSDNRIIAIQDKVDCLGVFCENEDTVDGVLRRIDGIFTADKNSPGIRLSSVHKAKGMESRRVFFLRPKGAECPHPMARQQWEIEGEHNILYVAITRAIETLVMVS